MNAFLYFLVSIFWPMYQSLVDLVIDLFIYFFILRWIYFLKFFLSIIVTVSLIVKMHLTKIVKNVLLARLDLSHVLHNVFPVCSFAMVFNTAQTDQMKPIVTLKVAKVRLWNFSLSDNEEFGSTIYLSFNIQKFLNALTLILLLLHVDTFCDATTPFLVDNSQLNCVRCLFSRMSRQWFQMQWWDMRTRACLL